MSSSIQVDVDTQTAHKLASNWLAEWSLAIQKEDAFAAAGMFDENGYWRDLLAFTWDLRTFHGVSVIAGAFSEFIPRTVATGFHLEEGQEVIVTERDGVRCIEAIFLFETSLTRARGHLRLVREVGNESSWKAWTLLTAAKELIGFEEMIGHRRPRGNEHARGGENWLDRKVKARQFESEDPAVVIIGAGQAGLALAARLGVLGVNALIIDREERVGDNWRNRYHSLALHNEIWGCNLPYIPFPPSFPAYVPKDLLGDWLESYATSMELNVWTSSELVEATYDESKHRWSTQIKRADGSIKTLHPRHFVLATGMSGLANFPKLEGASDFTGPIVHSSQCNVDSNIKGKRVLVVGSGNSAHDISQELHANGAQVTMLQRTSTCIVSVEPSTKAVFNRYREDGPAVVDVDFVGDSIPYPLMTQMHKGLTKQFAEWDKELLASLEKVGFKLDTGDDGSGFYIKYLRTGGGYYLNVGCSELIASGEIKIKQGVGVEHLTADTAVFTDGSSLPADMVVVATGYKNMKENVRNLLGDEVAERVGEAWGFDQEGELRNMWKRTAQEGFWFMGGSLAQSRNYSKYLAMQIKAIEVGILPGWVAESKQSVK
jgi:cation diffusion facilitator CzcD-associated flavoprotein CzcO